jgi:hypothetical protein
MRRVEFIVKLEINSCIQALALILVFILLIVISSLIGNHTWVSNLCRILSQAH